MFFGLPLCKILGVVLFLTLAVKAYQYVQWILCKPDFTGKTVFISGGSSGIGECLAQRMVALGAKKVIIAARRQNELDRVKEECVRGKIIQTLQLDLSKPEECLQRCTELFKKEEVDIVINNGGISQRDSFIDLDFSVCTQMMNVNCLSHIAVCKAALPGMIARKSGHIVNILSISGYMGTPMRTMYCASKFGLSGFGKVLRVEGRAHGIEVTQVYPSYVQTNISKNAMTGDGTIFGKTDPNIKRGITADACVRYITKAMTLKYAEMTIGGTMYKVLYHLSVFLPQIVMDTLSDRVMAKQISAKAKAQ